MNTPDDQSLLFKLDEWQHAHLPIGQHPWLQRAWYTFWRPLCNYVEWRNLRFEKVNYRPYADLSPTYNATTRNSLTHTEYTFKGQPTRVECNIPNCTICHPTDAA